jgi:hypothetical protein
VAGIHQSIIESRSTQPEERRTNKKEGLRRGSKIEQKKHHFPIKLKQTIAEVRTRHRLTKVSIERLVNPERVEDDCDIR